LALQTTTVDEPATTELGLQETVVFVASVVTARLYVPEDGEFLVSPP
jgi:hypothetical protein